MKIRVSMLSCNLVLARSLASCTACDLAPSMSTPNVTTAIPDHGELAAGVLRQHRSVRWVSVVWVSVESKSNWPLNLFRLVVLNLAFLGLVWSHFRLECFAVILIRRPTFLRHF
jgi:hypothetical protein